MRKGITGNKVWPTGRGTAKGGGTLVRTEPRGGDAEVMAKSSNVDGGPTGIGELIKVTLSSRRRKISLARLCTSPKFEKTSLMILLLKTEELEASSDFADVVKGSKKC